MHRIEFSRRQAFILEDGNVQRMLGIVHSSFGGSAYNLTFSVALTSEKKIQFDSVDDLLRHDNTLADPIHHLRINATAQDKSAACSIFFYGEKEPHLSGVTVNVESNEQRWAVSLAAELEEQVERTKLPGLVYQLRQSVSFRNLVAVFLLPLAVAVGMFSAFMDLTKLSGAQEERRELLRLASEARTTEDKLDFLIRAQVATLRDKSPESFTAAIRLPQMDIKLAVGLLPMLVSVALLWYLLKYCYPPAVFSWGDSGRQYQRLIERRKNLWSIVVTVIVLGFLVNLSSPVISSWLGV